MFVGRRRGWLQEEALRITLVPKGSWEGRKKKPEEATDLGKKMLSALLTQGKESDVAALVAAGLLVWNLAVAMLRLVKRLWRSARGRDGQTFRNKVRRLRRKALKRWRDCLRRHQSWLEEKRVVTSAVGLC